MSLIEIRGLKKYYKLGDNIITALDGLDLEIEDGECVALSGTSGSGKSTLLNMLAGLERPSKGTIKYGNISLTDLDENQITKFRNLNVGFVFQSYNLLPYLSAWENVSLPLTFKGLGIEDRKKEAAKILKEVGLSDRMNNKPNELSGGRRRRVSIARAFVGRPRIIFADEPTGNLDTKTSFEIMNLIKKITRENNQTFIMVTHDDEMTEFADKVLYMRDGHLEKVHEKYTIDEVLKK